MHLMSRSEFVLILQRHSQTNAGPKNAKTRELELDLERATFREAINIRDRIKLISCCGCVTRHPAFFKHFVRV